MSDARLLRTQDAAETLAGRLPPLLVEAYRVAATVAQGVHGRRRVGIGETDRERAESLLAIRSLQLRYGHIYTVIVRRRKIRTECRLAIESTLSIVIVNRPD